MWNAVLKRSDTERAVALHTMGITAQRMSIVFTNTDPHTHTHTHTHTMI